MSNKRTIPEIRERLHEIADETGLDELHSLADETYRRTPIKRARNKSAKVTPELAVKIREFCVQNPDLHQRDVGQQFNVNAGRVSETLNKPI